MRPSPDDSKRGLTRYTREVLHAATVDIVSKALSAALLAGLALLGLLIWRGGTVPAWLFAVALVLLVAASVVARAQRRRVGELLPVEERAVELEGVVDLLADALERHDEYTRHVAVVLDNLQRVVAGALGVDLREYIERGILEPARDLLTQAPDESVRLSVLVPEAPGADRWRMVWSAGHSLAGREGYNEPIARTLSRYAYETGRPQKWDDVLEERGFEQHPAASAPTRSMLSLPVHVGDDIVGVFNVIAAQPYAFDPAEERYIASLGGAINIAVGYWLTETT
ncbi:MAG: GAF domain-containing protein [Thermoleophilaceae bacterium]